MRRGSWVFFIRQVVVILLFAGMAGFAWSGFTTSNSVDAFAWLAGALVATVFGFIVINSINSDKEKDWRPQLVFLNKARMVRSAKLLLLVLAAAPASYLLIAALVTLGQRGFTSDQTFVLWFFFILVIVSVANIGFTVFLQTRKFMMRADAGYDPVGRTYLTMVTGAILSEMHAIFGLVLTLLSGSIPYGVGFSLVTWASLLWVRGIFKQNLAKLPDA